MKGEPGPDANLLLFVNLIMTADVDRDDLMALDDQLQGDPVTDVD